MMINYDSMTNEELDKAAADMVGLEARYVSTTWNPTDPDSNQAERYLFPKLRVEHGMTVKVTIDDWDLQISIYKLVGGGQRNEFCYKQVEFKDKHDTSPTINRTKVIACLKAMEKINES